MSDKQIHLRGRIILTGDVKTLTGLRIGGSAGALAIGGIDLPVIRNSRNQQPYIPGSSLKGKMRSLAEKMTAAPLNRSINGVYIHVATHNTPYDQYWVYPLFGVTGEIEYEIDAPTRRVVRDVALSAESIIELNAARTELPFSEIKTEVAIDRITSAATPRQVERVPAGAVFAPMELVLNIYTQRDLELIAHLLTCLQLVEDDYLGGHGSRGSGKVAFEKLCVACRNTTAYTTAHHFNEGKPITTLPALLAQQTALQQWAATQLAFTTNGGA
jgi:CRISPR-associated protein Csm3